MSLFSERYGYTKPSDVMIREQITPEIQNAICSCFDRMEDDGYHYYYVTLQKYLWTEFLHRRELSFNVNPNLLVATNFIEDKNKPWYEKLDLIDKSIEYLMANHIPYVKDFIFDLNHEFEQLHFAYRIVDNQIVEITSKEEIRSIEDAIQISPDNIKLHLGKALQLFGKKPQGDYSGSIQESISAVEALCRQYADGNDLGKALYNLKKKGVIPNTLYKAFEDLYSYTNDESTGIRHALMDSSATYTPSSAEALFMLVACSAFINYLEMKEGQY